MLFWILTVSVSSSLPVYQVSPVASLHIPTVSVNYGSLRHVVLLTAVRFAIGIGLEQRGLIEAGRVSKLIVVNGKSLLSSMYSYVYQNLGQMTERLFLPLANYLADTFLRLAKSVFGRLFEVLEVHGTSRASWIPQLLRHFPRDQLPEWYGGTKYHKPVAVYG